MLKASFPELPFAFTDQGRLIASLPMPNREGDLLLYDDGDEITVFLGDITHCHFSQEYLGDGQYSPETEACEELLDYLKDLFADRVIFYHRRNRTGDGSTQLPTIDRANELQAECKCFLWSRTLN
jgi:hypothetical protein